MFTHSLTWIIVGVLLALLSIVLRARGVTRYEIRPIDMVLLLVPLIIWLAATGKLQRISVAGIELEAIANASKSPIDAQVSKIPDVTQPLEPQAKGGGDTLQRLVKERAKALAFVLGSHGYVGPWIERYFRALSPYLKYVVLNEPDGKFYALLEAKSLLPYLEAGRMTYERFNQLINSGTPADLKELATLPGFIPAKCTVKISDSKLKALETMEACQSDTLGVVSADEAFKGVIERAKLTAGLLIDLAKIAGAQR